MEQMTLFESEEEIAFQRIRPALSEILACNLISGTLLTFAERKNYHSVLYDGSVVVRLCGGSKPFIEIPNRDQTNKKPYKTIKLNSLDEIQQYIPEIENSLQAILGAIPKEFDCCSRYMECSDNLACTNPDPALARLCGYRKILGSGRVFFGKNRNID